MEMCWVGGVGLGQQRWGWVQAAKQQTYKQTNLKPTALTPIIPDPHSSSIVSGAGECRGEKCCISPLGWRK